MTKDADMVCTKILVLNTIDNFVVHGFFNLKLFRVPNMYLMFLDFEIQILNFPNDIECGQGKYQICSSQRDLNIFLTGNCGALHPRAFIKKNSTGLQKEERG